MGRSRRPRDGGRGRRFVALAGLTLVVLAALAAPAGAADREVTRAEAVALVQAARTDPQALDDLRLVTAIDGRPVDLRAVTGGPGAGRDARLSDLGRLLGGPPSTPAGPTAPAARRDAARVLDQPKYHRRDVPKPFRTPLQWLGRQARRLYDPVADALGAVIGRQFVPWFLLVLVVGGTAAVLVRLIDRRSRAAVAAPSGRGIVDLDADPDALDDAATSAERAGDHATAVRLRYEAGLLRLARAGRLDLRLDTTARGAADQVDDPVLDDLTDTFELVVYGGAPAGPADSDAARHGWAALRRDRVRR